MGTSNFVRGAVIKCSFPYVDSPSSPGPHPHYCLFIDAFELSGDKYVAVCYGTSRLDDALLEHHSGAVFSVDSRFVKGSPMPGRVTHFVCSHVAVIPDRWIYSNFSARLDFIRPERREGDHVRQRLFTLFEVMESIMLKEALTAVNHMRRTGKPGLPGHAALR